MLGKASEEKVEEIRAPNLQCGVTRRAASAAWDPQLLTALQAPLQRL